LASVLRAAHATSVLVGVNVVAVDQMNSTQQDALVAELEREAARANPLAGRGWAMPALSDADPEGFRRGYTPLLASLEAAGVHLVAFELGNEINMTWDNADFRVPNSGRVLGVKDLENPNDTEARSVAEGFRAFVKIIATLKDLRDHLSVNKTTPVILGGLGNVGLAHRVGL
jgi:hypothetical protein